MCERSRGDVAFRARRLRSAFGETTATLWWGEAPERPGDFRSRPDLSRRIVGNTIARAEPRLTQRLFRFLRLFSRCRRRSYSGIALGDGTSGPPARRALRCWASGAADNQRRCESCAAVREPRPTKMPSRTRTIAHATRSHAERRTPNAKRERSYAPTIRRTISFCAVLAKTSEPIRVLPFFGSRSRVRPSARPSFVTPTSQVSNRNRSGRTIAKAARGS